jgi:hypothetical protein
MTAPAPAEAAAPSAASHAAVAPPARHARPAVRRVAATAPELRERVEPLLNKGADMNMAAQGFRSGEQFAAVAHAARNTNVPFVLLKHRVVSEHQSLAAAIHASRPELDASVEANRAIAEARSDVAALGN